MTPHHSAMCHPSGARTQSSRFHSAAHSQQQRSTSTRWMRVQVSYAWITVTVSGKALQIPGVVASAGQTEHL